MILGVDEVGRGCLAGPVVAGAVVLAKRTHGLADSKKLTKLQREKLNKRIRANALGFGIGWVSPSEVDQFGLTEAVRLAMKRAIEQVVCEYDELIIDGNYNYFPDNPRCKPIVRADDSVAAVSAASIIAKVARDAHMVQMSLEYPGYYFDEHVGYGTAKHLEVLQTKGACAIHRRSFAPVRAMLLAE